MTGRVKSRQPKAGEVWADGAQREWGPLEIVDIGGHTVIQADFSNPAIRGQYKPKYWTLDGINIDYEH